MTLRLIPAVLYTLLLFALSSIPGDSAATPPEQLLALLAPALQNFLHIPAYAGLTLIWYWALRHKPGVLLTAPLVAISYGVFDELYQRTVPGRYGSLTDLAFDAIGVMAAYIALKLWLSKHTDQPTDMGDTL